MTAKLFKLLPLVLFSFATCGFAQIPSSAPQRNYNEGSAKESLPLPKSFHSFVQANFLYWHVSEDFLDLFLGGPQTDSFTEHPRPFHFQTKYHPGLQLAVGFSRSNQKWSFVLDTTNLHFHNSTFFTNHTPNFYIPSCEWFLPFFGPTVAPESTMKARWSFLFQDFGLHLFRSFFSNNYWTLNPFFGMKLLFIDQRYDLFFHNVSTTDFSISEHNSLTESFSWALGPRIGTDLDCSLGKGVHFLGNGAFGLLYQEFCLKHYNTASPSIPQAASTKGSYHKLCPLVDAKLGLSYDFSLSQNIYMTLSALYEFHYLGMQQQMHVLLTKASVYAPSASIGGDLFMHGLTTGVRFRW